MIGSSPSLASAFVSSPAWLTSMSAWLALPVTLSSATIKVTVRNGLPLKLACHVPTNCLAFELVAGLKSWAKTIAHDTSNSTVPNAVERIIGLHAENLDIVILRRGRSEEHTSELQSLRH